MADRDEAMEPPVVMLLKASQVAALFNVNVKTVYAWLRAGRLGYVRTPMGGVRIKASEVAVLLNGGVGEEGKSPLCD